MIDSIRIDIQLPGIPATALPGARASPLGRVLEPTGADQRTHSSTTIKNSETSFTLPQKSC